MLWPLNCFNEEDRNNCLKMSMMVTCSESETSCRWWRSNSWNRLEEGVDQQFEEHKLILWLLFLGTSFRMGWSQWKQLYKPFSHQTNVASCSEGSNHLYNHRNLTIKWEIIFMHTHLQYLPWIMKAMYSYKVMLSFVSSAFKYNNTI